MDLILSKIESVYNLHTFYYSLVILKINTGIPYLFLKSSPTYHDWKKEIFFVKTCFLGHDLLYQH